MLSDGQWALLEPLIEACRPKGKTPPQDLRRTLSAILWRHQNGAKWRAVPEELGPWWRAAQIFIRWARAGVWERLLNLVQQSGIQLGMVFLDGTSVRAHQKAAGARRKGDLKLSDDVLQRHGVAPALDDLVEHIAILIDGAPQPMLPTNDADNHFIQVPNVSPAWQLAPEAPSIFRTELLAPSPDRLIGDNDCAFEQHLLDQPQAQREPEVQPNGMSDDLRREPMALVADRLGNATVPTAEALTKSYRDITPEQAQ